MFSYNSYLLLGTLAQQGINLPFLTKNGYELSKCNYSFNRTIDSKGQVQSKAQCEIIELEFLGIPSNPIIEWAINSRRYHDGAIIFCNNEGVVLEKVNFFHAACTYMNINYINTGSAYTSCDLVLTAKSLKIGEVNFSSNWMNS